MSKKMNKIMLKVIIHRKSKIIISKMIKIIVKNHRINKMNQLPNNSQISNFSLNNNHKTKIINIKAKVINKKLIKMIFNDLAIIFTV